MNRILLALAVASSNALVAQTGDGGPGGQYYIHGIFNPVIADVQKIGLDPVPFDSIIPVKPLQYQMLPAKFDVPAHVDSIAPAKLNVLQTQEKLYKGFVKAGFGLYTTPLAELYYDQTRSRTNNWGIHYKHLSSNGGLDDVGPSDYSFNRVDGFYTHFLRTHEVGGGIIYDRRRVTRYGYPEDAFELHGLEEPSVDDLKQVYNDIGFRAGLKSLYKDSTRIAHAVGLEVHTFNNLAQSREMNLRLTADLAMADGSETYTAGLLIDNNAYKGVLANDEGDFRQNGTLIGLTPGVRTEGDKYVVELGVGMYVDAMQKTTFHFFPNAYLSYSLFGDMLVPYAGVDGARKRNGLRSLAGENPWITDAPSLTNSSLMYDIHGGLRGSMSSSFGFDVRVSKIRWKDKALFVNESYFSYGNEFAVVYDRVDILDIMGQVNYAANEQIEVTGRINIYSYDTDAQAEAWNLPPYTLSLIARYDIRDKLILKAEAQFVGRRTALTYSNFGVINVAEADLPYQVDLEGYMDLFLGAEYRYNKRLSVWFDVSNLSASKYERWYRYPVQRTLFMGGATYAF